MESCSVAQAGVQQAWTQNPASLVVLITQSCPGVEPRMGQASVLFFGDLLSLPLGQGGNGGQEGQAMGSLESANKSRWGRGKELKD